MNDASSDRTAASDEALMRRYQRGDRSAFAELVQRHHAPVYNFVLRYLRSPSAAEDLTQEAFLRVVQKAADFKHEARFSTWLYTIARNLCVDHARKMSLRQHPSLDQTGPGEGGSRWIDSVSDTHPRAIVERVVMSEQVRCRIVAAVDALPDDQREVFLLREVADLPFKEIARLTVTPENTVKSRMRYALDRLKVALSEFEEYARALR